VFACYFCLLIVLVFFVFFFFIVLSRIARSIVEYRELRVAAGLNGGFVLGHHLT